MSLKQKTISGIFWSILRNIGARGATFIVTIILARLLTPSDFGLIGMLTIFISISLALISAGFNQALIQKKDADELDYSSVFWINLVVSILLYLILFFCASLIARFYEQDLLVDLTRVLSLVFIINAFSYIQETRLIKEMRFKKLLLINMPSVLIAGIISILLAFYGFGVWSIVALQVVNRLLYAFQIWIYSEWKPKLIFDSTRAKSLFSFGGRLMVSSVIHTIYQNVYLVVIGKFFSLKMVGYYQNANNLVQYPVTIISGALSSVTFSAFSSIQDNNKKLKEGYKKIIGQILYLMTPIYVYAAILATPLFRFVFTEKWLQAVPFFQILCIVGILYPLNYFNLTLVNVKGRSDIFLKLEIVKKIIITIGLIVSIPFGIWAIVIFQAINPVFSYLLNSYYTGRFIDYPISEQLLDVLPILILNAVVGLGIWVFNLYLGGFQDLLRLFIAAIAGIICYILISWLTKLAPYIDILKIIKSNSKFHKLEL